MSYDPNWTLAQIITHQETACEDEDHAAANMLEWSIQQILKDLEHNYEQGIQAALMQAIRECAFYGLPMPEWVRKAYLHAFDQVVSARENSWDAVFGSPWPKSARLNAIRKRKKLGREVCRMVDEIRKANPEIPIDVALFGQIGQKMRPPIGKTLAGQLYYGFRAEIRDLLTLRVPGKKKDLP